MKSKAHTVLAVKFWGSRSLDASKMADMAIDALAEHGLTIVSVEPTEAMLVGARDWSVKKYGNGRGIGNDAACGCWQAMLRAAQETG